MPKFLRYIVSLAYCILICCNDQVFAQNARFSQIESTPLMLNPSLAGRTSSGFEFSVLSSWQNTQFTSISHQNFHIQTNSDYIKYLKESGSRIPDSSSNDKKTKKGANGYWAWGFNYYQYGNDLTGITQNTTPLKANFISITIARHFYFPGNEKHYAGLGFQGTFANGKLKEGSGLVNDKEISGGGFRYKPTGNNNAISDKKYFDWQIGGYYGFKSGGFYYEVGGAMYHLFYPHNDIFTDEETRLRHRATIHSVFGISVSPKFDLIQKNIYWAEGLYYFSKVVDTTNLVALWSGIELKHKKLSINNKLAVDPSIYTRSFKTIMPCATFFIGNNFSFRYSYEWPVNPAKYKAYTARRTELSLFYHIGKKYFADKSRSDKYLPW